MIKYFLYGITLLLSVNCQAADLLDRIVAKINNQIITETQLQDWVDLELAVNLHVDNTHMPLAKEQLMAPVLQKRINDMLQLQLAEKFAMTIDDNMYYQALNDMAAQQSLSIEQYREKLINQGVSYSLYQQAIKNELLINQVTQYFVVEQLAVQQEEIDQYINSAQGAKVAKAQYHLKHILLVNSVDNNDKVKDKAQSLFAEIKNAGGKNFHGLAITHSQAQNALNGGDLGWRQVERLPLVFANIVPTMQVGEVVGPIESDSGYHIILLVDKKNEDLSLKKQALLRQILIKPTTKMSAEKVQNLLKDLRKQLLSDKNKFVGFATKYSQEHSSKMQGGNIGWVSDEQLLPEFAKVVNKLAIGEISNPFATEMGWHIVEVMDRRTHALDGDIKQEAKINLLQRKYIDAKEAWVKQLRAQANIEVFAYQQKN